MAHHCSIALQAIAGDRTIEPESLHVYCLTESPMSNSLSVMTSAAARSPKLTLDGLHSDGIDVTWQAPQLFGDAHISVILISPSPFCFVHHLYCVLLQSLPTVI